MTGPTPTFLMSIVLWVSHITGMAPVVPRVVVTSIVDSDGHYSAVPLSADRTKVGMVAAITRPGQRPTIYLNPAWRQGDVLSDCDLAHEVTHAEQFNEIAHGNNHWRCLGDMERQAYIVEIYCFSTRGDPGFWDKTGVTPSILEAAMSCR